MKHFLSICAVFIAACGGGGAGAPEELFEFQVVSEKPFVAVYLSDGAETRVIDVAVPAGSIWSGFVPFGSWQVGIEGEDGTLSPAEEVFFGTGIRVISQLPDPEEDPDVPAPGSGAPRLDFRSSSFVGEVPMESIFFPAWQSRLDEWCIELGVCE